MEPDDITIEKERKKQMAKKRAIRKAKEMLDNRPWFDRAGGKFWKPEKGQSHTVVLVGDPEERVNDFGNRVLDVPTNLGILSTGSYSILRPLAQAYKAHGGKSGWWRGLRLMFIATGQQNNPYTEVQVKQ